MNSIVRKGISNNIGNSWKPIGPTRHPKYINSQYSNQINGLINSRNIQIRKILINGSDRNTQCNVNELYKYKIIKNDSITHIKKITKPSKIASYN